MIIFNPLLWLRGIYSKQNEGLKEIASFTFVIFHLFINCYGVKTGIITQKDGGTLYTRRNAQ